MAKSTLFATALLLMLCGSPALARDDGGFGVPSTSVAPKALGDNTAELIARGDIPTPEGVANIEPAAGDENPAKVDDGKKAANTAAPATSPAQKTAQKTAQKPAQQ